ncbi:hypothetical protein WG66_003972 [Moniliophthora roreri]|nr:hypothetical protein WG66_003972 [Moniliophthora roreri]
MVSFEGATEAVETIEELRAILTSENAQGCSLGSGYRFRPESGGATSIGSLITTQKHRLPKTLCQKSPDAS